MNVSAKICLNLSDNCILNAELIVEDQNGPLFY